MNQSRFIVSFRFSVFGFTFLPTVGFCFLFVGGVHAAEPVVVFEPADAAIADLPNLLPDPGFEFAGTARSTWRPYVAEGYELDSSERHGGARSIRCRAVDDRTTRGAATRIEIKQHEARPIIIEAWTKCANVETAPSPDYSLYADLTMADGSRQWAQFARCPTGGRDWGRVQLVLRPTQSVAAIDLHCLFRNTPGTAWFDDVSVREIDPGRIREFDGQFVIQRNALPTTRPFTDLGGLFVLVQVHDPVDRVVALEPIEPGGGIAKIDSPKYGLRGRITGAPSDTGDSSLQINCVVVEFENTGREPKALTLYVCRRFDAVGGWWWDDGVRRRPIAAGGQYANLVWAGAGKSGWMSRYPLSVVNGGMNTLSMSCGGESAGLPEPRITRFGYDASLRMAYTATDVVLDALGSSDLAGGIGIRNSMIRLIVEMRRDQEIASFRKSWCTAWPDLAPLRRIKMGVWMPFAPISRVERPEDFGFAFKEGTNDLPYDNAHDILTFHYTEPQSFWLKMSPGGPRDYAACVAALKAAATDDENPQHREAAAALASACKTADGRYYVTPRREPWCDGAVFILNPSPFASAYNANWKTPALAVKERLAGGIDGEYLDSLDGWADTLNFELQQIRAASFRTYDPVTKNICLLNAFSIYEYCMFLVIGDFVRGRDYLLMANFCPTRYWWMAPLFDVMGQEVNWKIDGQWFPMSDEDLWYRRALCGRKPYCLLMNTDFDHWTFEDSRRYMMRCAAYGFFPGFFSHNAATKQYFETPALYNRDRPLFKQFIPVIRTIAEAGWQPVTLARAEPVDIRVERFGDASDGPVYFTLHNPTDGPVVARLAIAREATSGRKMDWVEMIGGAAVAMKSSGGGHEGEMKIDARATCVLGSRPVPSATAASMPAGAR